MSVTRYGFLELWNDLEDNYNTFTSENTICASSLEDADAYEKARTALKDMIDVGREAQAVTLWYPLYKVELSIKAKDSFARHFGVDQIPPVKGAKSLAFLKDVMLPHIERSLNVEVDSVSVWLGTFIGVDFAAETLRARKLVEIYKGIIAEAEISAEAKNDITNEVIQEERDEEVIDISGSTAGDVNNDLIKEVTQEEAEKVVGVQFRLFASSSGERMPAPVQDIAAAAVMPGPGN